MDPIIKAMIDKINEIPHRIISTYMKKNYEQTIRFNTLYIYSEVDAHGREKNNIKLHAEIVDINMDMDRYTKGHTHMIFPMITFLKMLKNENIDLEIEATWQIHSKLKIKNII